MFLRFRFHFVAVHRQFLWPTTSSSPLPNSLPVSRLLCLPRFGHCLLLTFYIILPHGCLCPGQDNFAAFACPSLHSPSIYLLYMYVCVYWHSENMLWPELLVIYLKPFKWQNLHGKRLSGLPGIPCLWPGIMQATLDYIIKSVSQVTFAVASDIWQHSRLVWFLLCCISIKIALFPSFSFLSVGKVAAYICFRYLIKLKCSDVLPRSFASVTKTFSRLSRPVEPVNLGEHPQPTSG